MNITKRIFLAALLGSVAIGSTACGGAKMESVTALPQVPQAAQPEVWLDTKMPPILRADSASYYGETVTITIPVSISDYFNYAFRDAEGTHYSFMVGNGHFYGLYAYGERAKFKDLFAYLVDNGGTANAKVTLTTSAQHGDNTIWSMVNWEKA